VGLSRRATRELKIIFETSQIGAPDTSFGMSVREQAESDHFPGSHFRDGLSQYRMHREDQYEILFPKHYKKADTDN